MVSDPPLFTVVSPSTVICVSFVTAPFRFSTPCTSIDPRLVNVPPKLTSPLISIVPSLVAVTPAPSDSDELTMSVAPGRLMTVARPFTFGCGWRTTVPSLSRTAPESAASAGRTTLPRTNSLAPPLMLLGVNTAGSATQIAAELVLTDPVKVPDSKTTTSVGPRSRSVGMLAAVKTAVGFTQSVA